MSIENSVWIAERGKPADPIFPIQGSPRKSKTSGRYLCNLEKLTDYFLTNSGNPPAAGRTASTPDGPAIAAYHIFENKPSHLENSGATTSETQALFYKFMTLFAAVSGKKEGMTGAFNYLKHFMMPGGENLVHWLVDVAGAGEEAGVFGPNILYNKYDPVFNNKPYACVAGAGKGKPDAGLSKKQSLFNSAVDADQWMIEALFMSSLYGVSDQADLIKNMRGSLTKTLSDDPQMPNIVRYGFSWGKTAEGYGFSSPNGELYTGYQAPAAWQIMGRQAIAQRSVGFLDEAQKVYAQKYGVTGPFTPVYSNGNWQWEGSDSNTHWMGFQYRAFAHLAFYYYLTGEADAKRALNNFVSWIKNNTIKTGDGHFSLPLELVSGIKNQGKIGSILRNGFDPHAHALFAQGLVYMQARQGGQAKDSKSAGAEKILDDLASHQEKNGSFKYTDDPDPNARGTYGFHNAEVGIALALYELLLDK